MEPLADAARPSLALPDGDALLPHWLRRFTIALYLAIAACVLVAGGLHRRHARWPDAFALSWVVLVPYCLAYAVLLPRVRRRPEPGTTDLRPYVAAFGDGALPAPPPRVASRSDAALLIPFVLHGVCGLFAGVEVVSWNHLPFGGRGVLAGVVGLLLGWIPAIPLAFAFRGAGWIFLAGALGPLLLFELAGTIPWD
jgi:hypothetical protein